MDPDPGAGPDRYQFQFKIFFQNIENYDNVGGGLINPFLASNWYVKKYCGIRFR